MSFGMLESQSDRKGEDTCWNRSLSAQQQALSNGPRGLCDDHYWFFCKFNMKADYCLQIMRIFCHITLVADKAARVSAGSELSTVLVLIFKDSHVKIAS